jgi:ABC-type transport system involved in cytochrome c biogenesis permease component
MRLNPVFRSDLRYRLTGRKAGTMVTLYLAVLGALAFLSLPPDLGRLDDLRQEGLLMAFLIVETVLAAYLTSAAASGEILVDGEKSVWDLAASPFPPGVIARGKVLTSTAYAVLLAGIAAPFLAIVAGIRGEPLGAVARAAVPALPFIVASGALGALYAGVFESDFTRSFVHWLTLLAFVLGATALPPPWNTLSPVRLVMLAVRGGVGAQVLAGAALYLALAGVAGVGIAGRVAAIRRAPQV